MKVVYFLILIVVSNQVTAFESFNVETEKVTDAISCSKPKTTPASGNWGALYTCIGGSEETVKMFINANADGSVKNIKLIWNDWYKDVGYGVHSDNEIARKWLAALVTLYAPDLSAAIQEAFFKTAKKTLKNNKYELVYTCFRGPNIDERMLVIVLL